MRSKTPDEIKIMREGGKLLATILNELAQKVEPGITGKDISAIASEQIKKSKLQPVLLGYEMSGLTYPDVMCISVNDEIVHGIPSKRTIEDGDVVKLDLTVGHRGLIVDSALTTVAGSKTSPEVKKLIDGTKRALESGINVIHGDGTRVGDISAAIQDVLDKNKLGIIRDLVGHGVGYSVHEDPNVPNYGHAGNGPMLSTGLTLAIEPMATLGDWKINVLKDGWTIVTRDNSLAAHFEHTVLVTDDGAEILTTI
jgi:methionyl aminopeptidase